MANVQNTLSMLLTGALGHTPKEFKSLSIVKINDYNGNYIDRFVLMFLMYGYQAKSFLLY